MQISHLRNQSIDYLLWDKRISESSNQLTYAYSWYLDVVSPNWEALVSENYEYIMPLPIKRKFRISYIVQPSLAQQLGIFSKQDINEKIITKFINKLPAYSYELNLNHQNIYSDGISVNNYILRLNISYKLISSQYSKNTQRNLDKSLKYNLSIKKDIELQNFISFYKEVNKNYIFPQQDLIEQLIEKGISQNAMTLYGVYNNKKNLIAAFCSIYSSNRITYTFPVSNSEGKSTSAMFFMIDEIIKNNEEKDLVLDFEGSRNEGIARFFKGFGAINQPYYIIKQLRPAFLIGKMNTK